MKYHDKGWLTKKYVSDGLTLSEISEECGVSISTIHKWVKRYDIEPEKLYQDKDWLKQKYVDEGLSQAQIAEICGVTDMTISNYMKKFDIDVRRSNFPGFTYDRGGYEVINTSACGKSVNVRHHRLLATLLVEDLDELDGKHVHHVNHIPWDNRVDNIEIMDPSEHGKYHGRKASV